MTSSSKQIWYGIAAIAVVALVAWALMNRTTVMDSITGNTGTQATTADTSTGGGSGTGTGTGTGAGKYPAGWPSDAPALQTGAKITYSGSLDPKTKIIGPTVVYTGSGTAATAVTFFKSQFTQQGWTFRGQGNVQGSVQLDETKATRRVTERPSLFRELRFEE